MVSKILHSGCAVRGVGLASRTLVAAGAPKRCGFSPGVYWKVSVIAVRDSALLTLSAENYTLDVGTLGLGEILTNRISSNKHTQAGLCVYVTWCVNQVHLIVYPANVHVRGLDHGILQYYCQRVNITQPVADAGYTLYRYDQVRLCHAWCAQVAAKSKGPANPAFALCLKLKDYRQPM